MLQRLYIKNYALIDELSIVFNEGFSVITGETGAGKSIILGALSLLLGNRPSGKNKNENKCIIEAEIKNPKSSLKELFNKLDLDFINPLIIRREISASGKNRAFVNDTPVKIASLKTIGELIIDIHSQHQNLLLTENYYQISVLDSIAQNTENVSQYQDVYSNLKSLKANLEILQEKELQEKKDADYYQYQIAQIEDPGLKNDENISLESELELQQNAESIKETLFSLSESINNDEKGIVNVLKNLTNKQSQISSAFPKSEEYFNRIESVILELRDIADDADYENDKITFNSERIVEIQERLDTINSLFLKHNVTSVSELLEINDTFHQKLAKINAYEDDIIKIKKEIEKQNKLLISLADKISKERQKAAPKIDKEVTKTLQLLGMPKATFKIAITETTDYNLKGKDIVNFLFNANGKTNLNKISDIASGGEISRVMLAVKSIVSGKAQCIIFDEIDTGISGEIADKMGNIMSSMSDNTQIISITHLPQIAAKGNEHYKVFKDDGKTNISKLDKENRVQELAKMLSGEKVTKEALKNAKSLLTTQ